MDRSPEAVYDALKSLEHIDGIDVVKSASYRKLAQEVLANPSVNLSLREAIADVLHQANHRLEVQTVNPGDSY